MKSPLVVLILVSFFATCIIGPLPANAQDYHLPVPGVMVHLSPPLDPPILKGIKVHPDDPFRFDFILDKGDYSSSLAGGGDLKREATKLIKYFLASLTIPEKDLWVNLSPYEKDRIIPQSFGLTEMGRDLLAEDYMLKQITASLIYPEDGVGRKFWKRIYEEAQKRFGTTNIPVNTFNKVWIVPEKAVVYENAKAGAAYVVESKLKVMLEQDYLALSKKVALMPALPVGRNGIGDVNALGSKIVRELVIPELTKEVNENKNFAQLRQVYNSLILATWYKKKIKDSILAQVYADKNKVAGVQYASTVIPAKAGIRFKNDVDGLYQEYLKAFKKGVFNYIKEEKSFDSSPGDHQPIVRKYFSGGVKLGLDFAMVSPVKNGMKAENVLNFTDKVPNKDMLNDDRGMIIQSDIVRTQSQKELRNSVQFVFNKDLAMKSGEGLSRLPPVVPASRVLALQFLKRWTLGNQVKVKAHGDEGVYGGHYISKEDLILGINNDLIVVNAKEDDFEYAQDRSYREGPSGIMIPASAILGFLRAMELRSAHNNQSRQMIASLAQYSPLKEGEMLVGPQNKIFTVTNVRVNTAESRENPQVPFSFSYEITSQQSTRKAEFDPELFIPVTKEKAQDIQIEDLISSIAYMEDGAKTGIYFGDDGLKNMQSKAASLANEARSLGHEELVRRAEAIPALVQRYIEIRARINESYRYPIRRAERSLEGFEAEGENAQELLNIGHSIIRWERGLSEETTDSPSLENTKLELEGLKQHFKTIQEKLRESLNSAGMRVDLLPGERQEEERLLKELNEPQQSLINMERLPSGANHESIYEKKGPVIFGRRDGQGMDFFRIRKKRTNGEFVLEQVVPISQDPHLHPNLIVFKAVASMPLPIDKDVQLGNRRLRISKLPDGEHQVSLSDQNSSGGTYLFHEMGLGQVEDWQRRVGFEDWKTVEDIFAVLARNMETRGKYGYDRNKDFQDLVSIIQGWEGQDGDIKNAILSNLMIARGWMKGDAIVASEWLRRFFRIYHHAFYLRPPSSTAPGSEADYLFGRIEKVTAVNWNGFKGVTYVEAISTNKDGGFKPGTNEDEVIVITNSDMVKREKLDPELIAIHEAQHEFDVVTFAQYGIQTPNGPGPVPAIALTAKTAIGLATYSSWELEYLAYLRTMMDVGKAQMDGETRDNRKEWTIDHVFGGEDYVRYYQRMMGESSESHTKATNLLRASFTGLVMEKAGYTDRKGAVTREILEQYPDYVNAYWNVIKNGFVRPHLIYEAAKELLEEYYTKKFGFIPQSFDIADLPTYILPAPLQSLQVKNTLESVAAMNIDAAMNAETLADLNEALADQLETTGPAHVPEYKILNRGSAEKFLTMLRHFDEIRVYEAVENLFENDQIIIGRTINKKDFILKTRKGREYLVLEQGVWGADKFDKVLPRVLILLENLSMLKDKGDLLKHHTSFTELIDAVNKLDDYDFVKLNIQPPGRFMYGDTPLIELGTGHNNFVFKYPQDPENWVLRYGKIYSAEDRNHGMNIYLNPTGHRHLPPEIAEDRMRYFADHDIGPGILKWANKGGYNIALAERIKGYTLTKKRLSAIEEKLVLELWKKMLLAKGFPRDLVNISNIMIGKLPHRDEIHAYWVDAEDASIESTMPLRQLVGRYKSIIITSPYWDEDWGDAIPKVTLLRFLDNFLKEYDETAPKGTQTAEGGDVAQLAKLPSAFDPAMISNEDKIILSNWASSDQEMTSGTSFEELVRIAETARLWAGVRIGYFRESFYRKSLKAYLLALEEAPTNRQLLLGAICVHLVLGEIEEAERLLNRIKNQYPSIYSNVHREEKLIEDARAQGGRLAKDDSDQVNEILVRHVYEDHLADIIFNVGQTIMVEGQEFIVDEVHHNAKTAIRDDGFQYYAIGRQLPRGNKVVLLKIKSEKRKAALDLLRNDFDHTAKIIALGTDDNGNRVLVTEYLPLSFDDFIKNNDLVHLAQSLGPTLRNAVSLGEDLLKLEGQNTRHGDLQHQNIRMTQEGEWKMIDLADDHGIKDVNGLASILYAATTGNILHYGLWTHQGGLAPAWAIINKGQLPLPVTMKPHEINPRIPENLSKLIWDGLTNKIQLAEFVNALREIDQAMINRVVGNLLDRIKKVELVKREGGINLIGVDKNLQVQSNRGEIKFHVDAAMLKELQDAPGFEAEIISMQPTTDISAFLGINAAKIPPA